MITKVEKERRKSGLFSSDIGRIMTGRGVEVALEKLGYLDNAEEEETEDWDEKQEWKIGKKAEPLILDAYDEMMGVKVERDIGTIMHPTINWMGCHQDARWTRNVEAKTVRKEMRHNWGEGGDQVNPYVLWQTVCQMAVSNTGITDIPVCFLHITNVRFLLAEEKPIINLYQIPRDQVLERYMIKKVTSVWEYIQQGVTPPPESLSDIKLIYTKADDPAIEATPDILKFWQELVDVKAILKAKKEKADELEFEIKAFMKNADALILTAANKPLATWKNDNDGFKFNKSRLEEEKPEIFKEYLEPKPGSRRFLIKAPKLKGEK